MKIDKDRALETLRSEVNEARQFLPKGAWFARVKELSDACDESGFKTMIAVLGTAILAKATHLEVDPFSLRIKGDDPERSYSARNLAKEVLAANAVKLGYDLGKDGPEPLNNQPWFSAPRITPDLAKRLHKRQQKPFEILLKILGELDRVKTTKEAREALRAFLQVRVRARIQVIISEDVGEKLSEEELLALIREFVTQDSEHGLRAQVVVAGLLDSMLGDTRIKVGKIHDPSRHFPGDVGIYEPDSAKDFERVFEVKDRPVTKADVETLVNRVKSSKVTKVGIVAVHRDQEPLNEKSLIQWAVDRQIRLGIYMGWERFVKESLFWSLRPALVVGAAYRAIMKRALEHKVAQAGIDIWTAGAG